MKRIVVVVKPNAKKTEILSQNDDTLHVAVAAPPDKNKANVALIKFLSKELGKVKLVSGATSRKKVLEFT